MKLQANWFEAVSICHAFGMQLARFDTEAEQAHVLLTVRNYYSRYTQMWLAGNDIVNEGIWKWAPDDSPIHVPLAWGPGEPNNEKRPENCLAIHNQLNNLLIDGECLTQFYFLCQK